MGHFPQDLLALLYPYLLPSARMIGVVVMLPGLSSPHVPPLVRLAVAVGVAVLAVSATGVRGRPPEREAQVLILLVGELGLGFIIGWGVSVFFEGIRWAGEVLDIQIGLRVGSLLDPLTADTGSLLGQLYALTALTFFFVVDGHHWVLAGVARSFQTIPPGSVTFSGSSLHLLLGAASGALEIGVRICAAGVTSLLLTDIALTVVGRHVPQMNVFFVGIPGKLWAGLAVLTLTAPLLGGTLLTMVEEIRRLVTALVTGG
jgi:flagellar biosynthetic protein FliR